MAKLFRMFLIFIIFTMTTGQISAQSSGADDCDPEAVKQWTDLVSRAYDNMDAGSPYLEDGKYLEPAIIVQQQRRLLEYAERPTCLDGFHEIVINDMMNIGDLYTLAAAYYDIIPGRTTELLGVSDSRMDSYMDSVTEQLLSSADMERILYQLEQDIGAVLFETFEVERPTSPPREDTECDIVLVEDWFSARSQAYNAIEDVEDEYASQGKNLEPAIVIQQVRRDLYRKPRPDCLNAMADLENRYLANQGDYYTLLSAYDIIYGKTNDVIGISSSQKTRYLSDIIDDDFYEDNIDLILFDLEYASGLNVFRVLGRPRPADAPTRENSNTLNIEFGNITVTDTQLEKVIDVVVYPLANCEGTADLTVTRTISEEVVREVSYGSEAGIQAQLDVDAQYWAQLQLDIDAYFKAYFNYSENEKLTESLSIGFSAAPGTSVTYEVQWIEVSLSGVIEIIIDGEVFLQEFTIPSSLRYSISNSQESCSE